jgi:nucleoside 2-deoxyribosyltransferase
MNIYFAGSIRGGREDASLYYRLIGLLEKYGQVLTGHIGDPSITGSGEEEISDSVIHDRDLDWLRGADLVVAEVTTASLGVGYEIGRAVAMGKQVICLFRPESGKRLSAMISGCPGVALIRYHDPEEAITSIIRFFSPDK